MGSLRIEKIKGIKKAVCIYCKKALTYHSNTGTKGLLGHQNTCKAGKYQKRIDDFQSRLVGKKSKMDESEGSVLAIHCFKYEDSRMDLARMIAQHDYPLRIVEHEGFRVFFVKGFNHYLSLLLETRLGVTS